jgi:hypothetical protein
MLRVVVVAACVVFIAACSSDPSTTPEPRDGYLTAVVDSVNFIGTDSTIAAAVIGKTLSFGAANEKGHQLSIFLDTIMIGEPRFFGEGIANTSYAVLNVDTSAMGTYFANVGGGHGRVTVTTMTTAEIAGVFELTVVNAAAAGKYVKNGSFRIVYD